MATDQLERLLRYRRELFSFIRALVRNSQDTEDVFQEVARIIVEKSSLEVDNFEAWAREIARRQALAYFRKKRTSSRRFKPVEEMIETVSAAFAGNPVAPEESTDRYEALRACLQKLGESARKLLRMRFEEDREYAEIAGSTGRNEGAVRRAVARARKALADCVFARLGMAGAAGSGQ